MRVDAIARFILEDEPGNPTACRGIDGGNEGEMRVGFIGLGQMGAGMALNLVKAGHEVTVYNRTPAKAADGSPTARCIAAISCC
jgi:NADPH-dependent glutamate synthase beta subunit-like oxidoreductase